MPDILTSIQSAYTEYLKSPCDECTVDDCDDMCFSCQRKAKHKSDAAKAIIALIPELLASESEKQHD
jgi:hypothetical protein